MRIELNGRPAELPEGASLGDAIVAVGADPERRGVAAAVDGDVLPRADWKRIRLREGQAVEVVTAVQGG